MVWSISFSTIIAITGLVLLICSAVLDSSVMDYLASIILCPAILMVFIINIYTWKKEQPSPLTFNKMVKADLDELFEKINNYYQNKTD
jgi:hypothetical protein